MSNIRVNNEASVSIALDQEEIDIIQKAYNIIHDIANNLWREDADETETYADTSTASDCIFNFMKDDIGVNVDEKRWY